MANATERSSITRCDTHFPQVAREFARSTLEHHGLHSALDAIDLLVSEVGTYAVVGGEFDHAWIEMTIDGDVVRVGITDPTSYLAAVVEDLPFDHTLRAGGIGLLVVDQVARRWGIDAARDGTEVWFEVDLATIGDAALAPGPVPARPA